MDRPRYMVIHTYSALMLAALLMCAPSVMNGQHVGRLTTVHNVSSVSSHSYHGTIAIGLPLVGRIERTEINGWWGWETQPSRSSPSSGFARSAANGFVVPTAGTVDINGTATTHLRIVDQLGRVIDETKYRIMADGTMDLSQMPSGVYTIIVIDSETKSYRVLIVK